MQKRKTNKYVSITRRRPEKIDPDAIDPKTSEYAGVDWDHLQTESLDIDPALAERIRSRRRLKQITLRIAQEQIDEARYIAETGGEKYQAVLRRWLAQGASMARTARLRRKTG
jgi:hypothetical protein